MVRLIPPEDGGYPVGLLDLEEPPPIYVEGTLAEAAGVAIVGSRRCTRYGTALARSFGEAMAASGWTTVSGLARGIDGHAHRGCLGGGGHAVAVLGSGVDVCYPAEHRDLYDSILATGGALVSEYPAGTTPERWRFPERNLLIAAMSAAVVVVEAAERGGALITARLAAEIGRPVFVVPGDVDRAASAGCNRLIKDGAHPVLGPDDLVEELSLILGPPQKRPSSVESPLPISGVPIDDLPELWGVTAREALVRVGLMEVRGEARKEGGMLFPR
jgi:DNA processing protein